MKFNIKNYLKQNGPELLIGIGISGFISAIGFTIKATKKSYPVLKEKEEEKGAPLTRKETIKAVGKNYIPTVVTAGISTACILSGTIIKSQRYASLSAAYVISETAFRDYSKKVKEVVGEKKEHTIRDEVAKDRVNNNQPAKEVVVAGDGTLCYESISGRYFKSDIEKIRRAENKLNKEMISCMYVTLNDLYYELGIESTTLGDSLGWNLNKEGLIEIIFSSILTQDDRPCLVIDYRVMPQYDYQKLY